MCCCVDVSSRGGTVSTSQGQDWLHRQTTNQRQLLQMPCKCHTSQSDVKYWSGSAKRVLTPNCSAISLICLPDIGELLSHASFFFWHAISHFSQAWTENAWQVIRHVSLRRITCAPSKLLSQRGSFPLTSPCQLRGRLTFEQPLTPLTDLRTWHNMVERTSAEDLWVDAVTLSFLSVLSK